MRDRVVTPNEQQHRTITGLKAGTWSVEQIINLGNLGNLGNLIG